MLQLAVQARLIRSNQLAVVGHVVTHALVGDVDEKVIGLEEHVRTQAEVVLSAK